jgi:hypothetical protein
MPAAGSTGRNRASSGQTPTVPPDVEAELKIRINATQARSTDGGYIQISDRDLFWTIAFNAMLKQLLTEFKPTYPQLTEAALKSKAAT